MLSGVAGIFVPAIPGVPMMLLLAVFFGFIDRWQHLTPVNLLVLLIIATASLAVDNLSGILGAKYGGASGKSMLWGMLGMLLGLAMMPPFGGLLGLFLAVLISEYIYHQRGAKAIKAAAGSFIGTVAGMIINLILSIIFILLFIVFSIK